MMADICATKMIAEFMKNGPILKGMKKQRAMDAIRMQPFFYASKWDYGAIKGDIIHFKRPDAYKEIK